MIRSCGCASLLWGLGRRSRYRVDVCALPCGCAHGTRQKVPCEERSSSPSDVATPYDADRLRNRRSDTADIRTRRVQSRALRRSWARAYAWLLGACIGSQALVASTRPDGVNMAEALAGLHSAAPALSPAYPPPKASSSNTSRGSRPGSASLGAQTDRAVPERCAPSAFSLMPPSSPATQRDLAGSSPNRRALAVRSGRGQRGGQVWPPTGQSS